MASMIALIVARVHKFQTRYCKKFEVAEGFSEDCLLLAIDTWFGKFYEMK